MIGDAGGNANGGGDIAAGLRNFLQILGAFFADGHFFGLLDGEIADVFDLDAELLDAGLETSAAKSRRAHVHAATALAEVHGHADDANFLGHLSLVLSDSCSVTREGAREPFAQNEHKARIAGSSERSSCERRRCDAKSPRQGYTR